jgi:hypothetical protein
MGAVDQVVASFGKKFKPASEKQIEAFVKKIGFPPPQDYLDIMRASNGGTFSTDEGDATGSSNVDLYPLAQAIRFTRAYEFHATEPKIIIIGSDGSDGAFCLDGRYAPARIIFTSFATPGEIGSSTDFGRSFVKFVAKLRDSRNPVEPGLPALPVAAADKQIRRFSMAACSYLVLDPDGKSIWVDAGGNQQFRRAISDGRQLDSITIPVSTRLYAVTPAGFILQFQDAQWNQRAIFMDRAGDTGELGDGFITGMTFNSTAVAIYTKSDDQLFLNIVDIATGEMKHRIFINENDTLHPSPDGRWIARHAARENTVQLEETATGRIVWKRERGKAESIVGFIFSSDQKTLFGAEWHRQVIAWDAATGRPLFKCGDRDHPASMFMSPVPGSRDFVTLREKQPTLVWWDGSTGLPKGKLVVDPVKDGHPYAVPPVISGDGRSVLISTQARTWLTWKKK